MYLAIITLPILGSIVSGFFGRKVGVSGAQLITCTSIIITTILAIIAFFEIGLNNIPVSINLVRWVDSESLNVLWGFQFDSLTVKLVGLFYFSIEIEAVLVLIQLYKRVFIPSILISRQLIIPAKASDSANHSAKGSSAILINRYAFRVVSDPAFISINKEMKYSTISKLNNDKNYQDSNFLQWFVGFTDAEGNFIINPIRKKDKSTVSSFSFMFKITLHIDDEKVLRYIKDKLGIGGVRVYKDEVIFNVTDQKGIALLIPIFDKYNLNTTKYLDYLDFKEAFLFYLNRDKSLTPNPNSSDNDNHKDKMVKEKILELKNKMNTNRVYFDRPEHSKIVITKSWLLGFIEGDGSFFLRRDSITPTFCIENTGNQLPVLLKIKEFLESSLSFDKYSLYKLKNTSSIAIATIKATNKGKSSASLTIKNIYLLNNYIIPLLNDMEFLTKKAKDFYDFKTICLVVYKGAHRKEEIRSLVLNLSNTMNNFRLSTYKEAVKDLNVSCKKKAGCKAALQEKLLSAQATIEHLTDGRVIDKATKKVVPQLNSCVYEIRELYGGILLANSLTEAASIVGLYPDTLSKYLEIEFNSDNVYVEIKKHKIRRRSAFFPVANTLHFIKHELI